MGNAYKGNYIFNRIIQLGIAYVRIWRLIMETLVVTPTEASKLLKTSPSEIYKKLEQGEIPAYKDGPNNNSWKIPKNLLVKCIEERALEEAKDRRHIEREVYGNVDM